MAILVEKEGIPDDFYRHTYHDAKTGWTLTLSDYFDRHFSVRAWTGERKVLKTDFAKINVNWDLKKVPPTLIALKEEGIPAPNSFRKYRHKLSDILEFLSQVAGEIVGIETKLENKLNPASYFERDRLFLHIMGEVYIKGSVYDAMSNFTDQQWKENTSSFMVDMGISAKDAYFIQILKHNACCKELPFVYQAGKFLITSPSKWAQLRLDIIEISKDKSGTPLSNAHIFSDGWLEKYAMLVSTFARKNPNSFKYPD